MLATAEPDKAIPIFGLKYFYNNKATDYIGGLIVRYFISLLSTKTYLPRLLHPYRLANNTLVIKKFAHTLLKSMGHLSINYLVINSQTINQNKLSER
jgi:hypothetical protein